MQLMIRNNRYNLIKVLQTKNIMHEQEIDGASVACNACLEVPKLNQFEILTIFNPL